MKTIALPASLLEAFRAPAFSTEDMTLSALSAGNMLKVAAGAPPARRVGLLSTLRMQAQTLSCWCWAAVSVSVAAHYDPGSTWTQCDLASAEIGSPGCCPPDETSPCNRYWTLSDPLTRVGHLRSWAAGSVPFDDVVAEVDSGNPLCCRTAWLAGGAHFVVLRGYSAAPAGSGEDDFVSVSDPAQGSTSDETYEEFCSSYSGSGTWTHSYFCQA